MKNIQVWESSEIDGLVDKHAYDISSFEFNDQTLFTLTDVENTRAVQMVDDGNYVKIQLDGKKIKLDYHQAVQMIILLHVGMDQNFEFREAKIIKKF